MGCKGVLVCKGFVCDLFSWSKVFILVGEFIFKVLDVCMSIDIFCLLNFIREVEVWCL